MDSGSQSETYVSLLFVCKHLPDYDVNNCFVCLNVTDYNLALYVAIFYVCLLVDE